MFPHPSSLGRSPMLPPPSPHHSGELLSAERLLHANLSRMLMTGNALPMPPMSPASWSYGNPSPLVSPASSPPFQNRKRRSDEGNGQFDVKRQRFQSPQQSTPVIHRAVPLRNDRHHYFAGTSGLPLPPLASPPPPPPHELNGQVPTAGDSWLFDQTETTLPVAKDKLSKQILDLFQACQQQVSDLKKKDVCRAELQREIQQIFPHSRLYLVGSSLSGFGMRSSDADLCLVITEEPMNQKTEARYILSLLQKHFYTRLSYIERPQLIRAKVPIVKFRDKVSGVEFDLNVNNVVGIRNTFLLRSYAHIESRVRPLVLVIKRWASYHGINDASRGTLSSYSLVLMVLHYLQTLPEPVLPSLQKNYPECFNPTMQLHLVHLAPRHIPPYKSKNESSLGDLFVGFLKYFATEFDWNSKIISVREGKAMQRTEGIEWRHKFICVEEPFDRTNTARAVHEKMKFDMIQDEFKKAWAILKDGRDLNSVLPLGRITCTPKR
ncbi:poly(A) RNA polymerase GLD2 isoform X2 [Hyperolius riggenbachi]|uniref:poly(A) RNA polymerase GLD2 isoform X2 n=1 Tax=Hyperolius riggenbachi TaxID=752182 RepID=UPI0035A2AFB4